MKTGGWILAASYVVLLIVSIVLVLQGSVIGWLTGLLLVVALLMLWREARQGRADRNMDYRG